MIVILGASCSGKDTLLRGLKPLQETEEFKVKMEYTTRPQRRKAVGTGAEDSYHFVKEELYLNSLKDKVFAANFEVETPAGLWYYGVGKQDTNKNDVILTNPTSFFQLKENVGDVFSIYLEVDQRERLIRMLKRGDSIHESYRRSIHDEGHFSGIKKNVDLIIDAGVSEKEDILNMTLNAIREYLSK